MPSQQHVDEAHTCAYCLLLSAIMENISINNNANACSNGVNFVGVRSLHSITIAHNGGNNGQRLTNLEPPIKVRYAISDKTTGNVSPEVAAPFHFK